MKRRMKTGTALIIAIILLLSIGLNTLTIANRTKLNKTENKKQNYIRLVLQIEMHTGIKIDIHKDNMLMFIDAKNEMIEVINQRSKLINKKAA